MINEFSRTEMLIGQEGLMSLKNAPWQYSG